MAGGKSDYLENVVLDSVLGSGSPATIYVALFTVTPTDAGGGTELSGGSYARVAVTNNATNWPAASGGSKSNGTVITFPTASGSLGPFAAFGLFDASSGGNLLYWGPGPGTSVSSGTVYRIPASGIVITED